MKALKKKWNSCRGASILLAMLFLLVCMMAGASVLMASASNAGKIDSNKKEQQKYLTLSSALNLLCDEFENVEYVGKYSYEQDDCTEEAEESGYVYNKHDQHRIYTQTKGVLQRRQDGSGTWLDGVLPLRNDLDWIFANHFEMPESRKIDGDYYGYFSLLDPVEVEGVKTDNPDKPGRPSESYTLDFKVDLSDAEKKIYGGLSDTVRIEVRMWDDGSIELTATLMEGDDPDDLEETEYVMTAVLMPVPDDWLEKQLVLSNHEGDKTDCLTGVITWELEHISKISR